MKTLYLDESGDHNLAVIDPQYPVFVLGGVIVDQPYAEHEVGRQLRQFKVAVFGRDDLILRTADISRNTRGFEALKDRAFRERFYERLNELMRGLAYTVVACAIRKDLHFARYGTTAVDPYLFGLEVLVERFCLAVGRERGGGQIVAERRNAVLDRELLGAWERLRQRGTRNARPRVIRDRIATLELRAKSENIAGLQLADLVVGPIGRFVLGKQTHEDFRIIESKLRQVGTRGYLGPGLVILPKQ